MNRVRRFGPARAAACVVLAATALFGARPAKPQPGPDAALAARVAAMQDSANRYTLAHQFHSALEVLRRIAQLTPRTNAAFEGAVASALGNTAVEARVVRGLPIPYTRSAVERVALLREAHARAMAGERKAEGPVRLRDLRVVWAGQLSFWGFVREGYQQYWSAHEASPLDTKTAGQAGWLELRFLDPASDGSERALKELGFQR